MLFITVPGAFVGVAARAAAVFSLALAYVLVPHSFVCCAILPGVLSLALFFIRVPRAFVYVAV